MYVLVLAYMVGTSSTGLHSANAIGWTSDACLSVLKGRWIQNPVLGKFLNAATWDYLGSPWSIKIFVLSRSRVYWEMIMLRLHYGLVWDLWFYVLPCPIFLGMGKERGRKRFYSIIGRGILYIDYKTFLHVSHTFRGILYRGITSSTARDTVLVSEKWQVLTRMSPYHLQNIHLHSLPMHSLSSVNVKKVT